MIDGPSMVRQLCSGVFSMTLCRSQRRLPPALSEGPCLTWTLAENWLHGFAIGAAIFGQEDIPIVIAVGSLTAHKIMCGTWLDF